MWAIWVQELRINRKDVIIELQKSIIERTTEIRAVDDSIHAADQQIIWYQKQIIEQYEKEN